MILTLIVDQSYTISSLPVEQQTAYTTISLIKRTQSHVKHYSNHLDEASGRKLKRKGEEESHVGAVKPNI